MVDLGFHGPRFTWVNKREVRHYIQERLYRGFANTDWREIYLKTTIHHLACTYTDYCPILLKLDNASTSWLGLSIGWAESVLDPTWTQPASIGWRARNPKLTVGINQSSQFLVRMRANWLGPLPESKKRHRNLQQMSPKSTKSHQNLHFIARICILLPESAFFP